ADLRVRVYKPEDDRHGHRQAHLRPAADALRVLLVHPLVPGSGQALARALPGPAAFDRQQPPERLPDELLRRCGEAQGLKPRVHAADLGGSDSETLPMSAPDLRPVSEEHVSCAKCGRSVDERTVDEEDWGFWSNGFGQWLPYCPPCARRTFGHA